MTDLATPYQSPHHFMSDFVKQKYALITKKTIQGVKISPKDYKSKSTLNKTWFVYFFYYVDGKRRKFERSSVIIDSVKTQINRIEEHKLKVEFIEILLEVVKYKLTQPDIILKYVYGETQAKLLYPSVFNIKEVEPLKITSIKDAINEVLDSKVNISNTYKNDLTSVKNRFLKYLGTSQNDSVNLLTKKLIVTFLNDVTSETSNRTYNNIKTNLKTFLEGLKDLEYIDRNFLDGVKNKQTKAKRNRALTQDEITLLFNEAKKRDLVLYYFLMHIYYALMRPQTIVRIKVKDVDFVQNIFLTDTKTGQFIKIIPPKIKNDIYSNYDFVSQDRNDYIFSKSNIFGKWDAKDENRRQYYTDGFKDLKEEIFEDYKNVSLTSLRHSGIGRIFETKSKELKDLGVSDYKNKAVEFIMPITNHKTKEQTKEYLRGISTEIHEDWSKYL